jgi:hypothetical protein
MFLHKCPLSRRESPCFQKAGLDTLSDGIFGVAMTLLILDVRLSEDSHPEDGVELVRRLLDLWPLRTELRDARPARGSPISRSAAVPHLAQGDHLLPAAHRRCC